MNTRELLQKIMASDKVKVQFLNNAIIGAKRVYPNKKNRDSDFTEVRFATNAVTPDDFMGDRGQDPNLGIILWVPKSVYREIVPEIPDTEEWS